MTEDRFPLSGSQMIDASFGMLAAERIPRLGGEPLILVLAGMPAFVESMKEVNHTAYDLLAAQGCMGDENRFEFAEEPGGYPGEQKLSIRIEGEGAMLDRLRQCTST